MAEQFGAGFGSVCRRKRLHSKGGGGGGGLTGQHDTIQVRGLTSYMSLGVCPNCRQIFIFRNYPTNKMASCALSSQYEDFPSSHRVWCPLVSVMIVVGSRRIAMAAFFSMCKHSFRHRLDKVGLGARWSLATLSISCQQSGLGCQRTFLGNKEGARKCSHTVQEEVPATLDKTRVNERVCDRGCVSR